jgi:hypothetical protein
MSSNPGLDPLRDRPRLVWSKQPEEELAPDDWDDDFDSFAPDDDGSAYAEMLAHGVVVEVCEVSEFGHANRSSRIGDRAKEAMAGRIPRRPRVGLRLWCATSPRRSSSVCQNYM